MKRRSAIIIFAIQIVLALIVASSAHYYILGYRKYIYNDVPDITVFKSVDLLAGHYEYSSAMKEAAMLRTEWVYSEAVENDVSLCGLRGSSKWRSYDNGLVAYANHSNHSNQLTLLLLDLPQPDEMRGSIYIGEARNDVLSMFNKQSITMAELTPDYYQCAFRNNEHFFELRLSFTSNEKLEYILVRAAKKESLIIAYSKLHRMMIHEKFVNIVRQFLRAYGG